MPEVGCKVPAMILYKVDFPAPFEPITVIKSPLFIVRFISRKAIFSSGVPSLKTIPIFFNSIIAELLVFQKLNFDGHYLHHGGLCGFLKQHQFLKPKDR